METPNTRAGRLTEKVMESIVRKIGKMPEVSHYNAIYCGVLEALSLEFPPDSGVVKYPGGGGMFIHKKR